MAENTVVVNVPNGVFYFRDSQHYLYGRKKTKLLEDTVRYLYTFPYKIGRIYDAYVLGADNIEARVGYGADYGDSAYGGPEMTGSSNINIQLTESPDSTGSLNATTRIAFNLDVGVTNPTRAVTGFNSGTNTITVAYTGRDSVANAFGLTADDIGTNSQYTVELSLPAAPDRAKLQSDPSTAVSYSTVRSGSSLSLSTIQEHYSIGNPIPLHVVDANAITWAKVDDYVWLVFPYKAVTVATPSDLPNISDASQLCIYGVKSTGKFYIVDGAGAWAMRDQVTHLTSRRVLMRVVNGPGLSVPYQNNTLYVIPSQVYSQTWYTPGLFNDTNTASHLFANLVTFWDGIPSGVTVVANKAPITIENITGNVLHIPSATMIADFSTHPVSGGRSQYIDDLLNGSGCTATLIGDGFDYSEGVTVFVQDMTKVYSFDGHTQPGTPVVITDILATDADDQEFTNVQFRTETIGTSTKLTFNAVDNKIYNPTFIKADDTGKPLVWGCSDNVFVYKDYNKIRAPIHNQCARLPGIGDYVRQHIPRVNCVDKYSFSFYASSDDSTVQVRIYEFNNNGTLFSSTPDVANATNTISYVAKAVAAVPTKYVARIYSEPNFSPDATPACVVSSGMPALRTDTTDIIVEIRLASGTTPLYIACVQFEKGVNPNQFSNNYDYAVVEYESGEKTYSTRFLASALDNPMNNGYMVMDIVAVDLQDTFLPLTNLTKSSRSRITSKYSIRPWAKLHGVNKYVRSNIFSKTRRQFKGEYFALPIIADAANLGFQANRIVLMQTYLGEQRTQKFTIIAEDADRNNLSDIPIDYSYALFGSNYSSIEEVKTNAEGVAWITAPTINDEEVISAVSCGDSSTNNGMQIKFEPAAGATFVQGELACLCDSTGNFSAIKVASSAGGVGVLSTYNSTNECAYDASTTATHVLRLSRVSGVEGLVEFPFIPTLTIDPDNNGSCVISVTSTITNADTTIPIYSPASWEANQATQTSVTNILDGTSINVASSYDGILHKSATSTLTKQSTSEYFDLGGINPISSSIKVSLPGLPNVNIYNSVTRYNTGLYFFVDYSTRRLYISDSTINTVTINYTRHPVRILNNRLYFSRHLVFFMIKRLYSYIQSTSIKDQHTDTALNTQLKNVIAPVNSFDFPLYIKPHVNVLVLARAKYNDMVRSSSLVYTHRMPLL